MLDNLVYHLFFYINWLYRPFAPLIIVSEQGPKSTMCEQNIKFLCPAPVIRFCSILKLYLQLSIARNKHLNRPLQIDAEHNGNGLEQLAMKRTWESGNHPYLFFNEDGATFTPLGFYVNNTGNQ